MKLEVKRFWDNGKATSGYLMLDGQLIAYTLEDEYREQKVRGETRIPEGEYEIVFRKEGGHHIKYGRKFPNMHKGMLHIINVPNFQYILIHIGNYERDTDGCLLVGDSAHFSGYIQGSTSAYTRVYPIVANALSKGEKVTIKFTDIQK